MSKKGTLRRTGFFGKTCLAMFLVTAGIACQEARADVRLPKVFGSHMVLQQQKPLIIWGWAAPGETVTVEIAGAKVQTRANMGGEWKVVLPAMSAGGPYILTVTG